MPEANDEKTESAAVDSTAPPSAQSPDDFARQAEEAPPGLVAEFVDFLIHNKKWWLTPIILVLLALGIIAFLSTSPAAPFIYNVF